MIVKQLDKKVVLKEGGMLLLQVLLHCHFNKIYLSQSELTCAAFLAKYKEGISLSDFCNASFDEDLTSSPQYARNVVNKLEDKDIIIKKGSGKKKKLFLSDTIEIEIDGNILLNLKALKIDETA